MVCIQILIYVKDQLEFIFYKYEKVKFHISKILSPAIIFILGLFSEIIFGNFE